MIVRFPVRDAVGNVGARDIDIAVQSSPMLVDIQSWTAAQMQSVFGSSPLATLVSDSVLGTDVVRVRFPQSTVGPGPYLQGTLMMPTPMVSVWVRMLVKWEPGFTTVGPDPAGHDNSYKLFFALWSNYGSRAGIGLANTSRYAIEWGITDRSTGIYYRPAETTLPGDTALGNITSEWSDDQWYEYVFGQVQTAPDQVSAHYALRRYTTNGIVNPGPRTHVGLGEKGNMPYGAPAISRVSLGGNKNKNNPTDMYIRWGCVQVATGANPFGVN